MTIRVGLESTKVLLTNVGKKWFIDAYPKGIARAQSTFKWVAKVITLAAFVTCYVLVLSIITMCYINPEKTLLINTNLYGEALIELLIFWSTVPLVIYNLKAIFASFFSP